MSYDIRQSQVIHTWPPGSIIDLPEVSLIMLCHDDNHADWGKDLSDQNDANHKNIIKDDRLAEAFRVDHFVIPPSMDGMNNLTAFCVRFPRAHYCPKCGLIEIINKDRGQGLNPFGQMYDNLISSFFCKSCFNNQRNSGPKLVPMRFVIATEEGFLDDFPWDWYTHLDQPDERGQGHKLYFQSFGGSASLFDIKIESRRRDNNAVVAHKHLGEIFDQKIFAGSAGNEGHYLDYVQGFMPKPWKGWHNNTGYINELITDIPPPELIMEGDELSPKAKRKFPRTMQRGAGNINFPIIYSGILLPQSTYQQKCPLEVEKIIAGTKIALIDTSPDEYNNYASANWSDFFLDQVNNRPNHRLNTLGYPPERIISFIQNHFGVIPEEEYLNKATLLRQQEFKAFTGPIDNDDKTWFRKKSISGNDYNNKLNKDIIDEVILLEKLSALKVFKGFTRVRPLLNEELIFAEPADTVGENLKELQRIQDARKDPLHTRELPAVEVRGEGIFLKFNNQVLNNWSDNYPDSRVNTVNNNLKRVNNIFGQDHPLINKRYLFLHSFSHILLKELAEDCGYSLSSLSEIIYASSNEKIGSEDEMNGILVYTTTSDSEGSLGGLVEKGNPEYLSFIIKKAVDKARWCSSDPLCITADHGQGFMGLNLAACYSCILLPETSCEKMNKYLDRATIIGTLQNNNIGMF